MFVYVYTHTLPFSGAGVPKAVKHCCTQPCSGNSCNDTDVKLYRILPLFWASLMREHKQLPIFHTTFHPKRKHTHTHTHTQ